MTPDRFDVDFVTVDTSSGVLTPLSVNTAWRIADGIPGAQPRA